MDSSPLPKLSYAHGTGLVPLLGQTIGDNLRATVERHGNREALVVRHQDYRATYRQLWDATTQLARALIGLGVQAGDRVGIWSTNRFEWVVGQYATARVGAILVNVNPAYQSPELHYALTQSGVSVLLHARGFRQNDYHAMLADVRPRCPDLKHVFALDDSWASLMRSGDSVTEEDVAKREAALQFDDPINIQYTSG